MEIEEIQALWSDMSNQLEQQKKLTNEIIMKMTQEQYKNKFRVITIFESAGALICFTMGIYILINFNKLDSWYLMTCGVVSLIVLIVLPIMVLKALGRIKRINIIDKNYKETIVSFTKAKTNLLRLQQFSIVSSFLLIFAVSAVFSKIWSNRDFFIVERNTNSYMVIGAAILFVIFISRWGYAHYKRITNSAENLLKGLE